ncbi:MAG TPA: transglutaminase-like domain-containing protein, partial [Candidatus Angelobacter sp.]|nr:transglutaminase-like domain-containing protein [Candidatus Angelobacter sp.]
SPEIFWREAGKQWYSEAEAFIGTPEKMKTAALRTVEGETDPEKKLRKLYVLAQQITNITYESSGAGTGAANHSVADVLARGYGSRNEIAETFAALARASGFEAELLRASSRKDRVFDPKMLLRRQLEAELVRVKLNGSELFLDPGTKLCPFGMVAWMFSSTPALLLHPDGGNFVVIPTATAEKSVRRRIANLTLEADGSAHGEVTLQFTGNEALERRLDALGRDDTERRREMKQELSRWLPANARTEPKEVDGWVSMEDPLVARFDVELPSFASVADRTMSVPANLFHSDTGGAFDAQERKYPVYFPFTYEELDQVTIQPPKGYTVSQLPAAADTRLASTRLITRRAVDSNLVHATRALVVNSIYFRQEEFQELKEFFDHMRASDQERVALTRP